MPHKRSPEKRLHQKERYMHHIINHVIPEINRPRYEVASTFKVKHNRAVTVTNDDAITMKHQRNAVGACVYCNSTETLHVHHIDRNHDNNLPENLLVLCAKCHINLHYLERDKCRTVTDEAKKNRKNDGYAV